jgi:branched-chain amino acid transport system permease protein
MLFLQLVADGLTAGATYALIAAGFAIIYNGTRVLHIAHGAVFALAGYAIYVDAVVLKVPLVYSVIIATLLAAVLGVAIERGVYYPLRRRYESSLSQHDRSNAAMIASIGVITAVQALLSLVFGTDTLYLRRGSLPTYEIGGLIVPQLKITIVVTTIVVFAVLHLFLTRTQYGRAMRAVVDDPELAQVLGMDRERFYVVLYAVGSSLAGIAVAFVGLDIGISPSMGFAVMFFAMIACIIGGMGYLPGAIVGAFLVGVIQQLTLWQLSGKWQDFVLFGILIGFLLLRPQGVFGHLLVSRRA